MDNWSKELDEALTNYVTPEEEDYEMPDTVNDGETTDDIEPQEATTTSRKFLQTNGAR